MSAEHPKLTAARAALEEGGAGVGPILALAFGARAAQDEGVSLVGEWWWITDPDGVVPTRMVWAGGRELYDEAVRTATERFGMSPVAVPLSAFFPVPEPSEGADR